MGQIGKTKRKMTLYRIFRLLAPEMMIEKTTEDIVTYLGLTLRPDKNRQRHDKYPVPENVVRICIPDFIALGLFEVASQRSPHGK